MTAFIHTLLPQNDRRNSAVAFLVLLSILGLGMLIQVQAGEASFGGLSGPECQISRVAGDHVCPGCGLTRSSALVLDGDFYRAFSVNAGGFFLVGVLLLWSLVHAWIMIQGQRSAASVRWLISGRRLLLFGVIFGWIARLV